MKIDTHGGRFEVRPLAEGGYEVRDLKAETPAALQLQPFPPKGTVATKHECNLMITEYLSTGRFELPSWYTGREITAEYYDRALEGRYGPGITRQRRATSKRESIARHELERKCTRLLEDFKALIARINTKV